MGDKDGRRKMKRKALPDTLYAYNAGERETDEDWFVAEKTTDACASTDTPLRLVGVYKLQKTIQVETKIKVTTKPA